MLSLSPEKPQNDHVVPRPIWVTLLPTTSRLATMVNRKLSARISPSSVNAISKEPKRQNSQAKTKSKPMHGKVSTFDKSNTKRV